MTDEASDPNDGTEVERALNDLGQPVGSRVDNIPGVAEFPLGFAGTWCRLASLSPLAHGDDLFAAFAEDREGGDWTYLSHGPFAGRDEFDSFLSQVVQNPDYQTYAVVDRSERAVGMLSLLRNRPRDRCVEVGAIHFAPRIQRTQVATEAVFLVARHLFDRLFYRRLEWKCDCLNDRSRASALRLGFRFEGVFRQHMVYKGRNRDTAWYAMLDHEWPLHRQAIESWLDPANFDSGGRQRQRLTTLRQSRVG